MLTRIRYDIVSSLKRWRLIGTVAGVLAGWGFVSRVLVGSSLLRAEQEEGHGYSCPMHPEVRSRQPGKCSKCGMKLRPTKGGGGKKDDKKKKGGKDGAQRQGGAGKKDDKKDKKGKGAPPRREPRQPARPPSSTARPRPPARPPSSTARPRPPARPPSSTARPRPIKRTKRTSS